jgi:hypothetical protein
LPSKASSWICACGERFETGCPFCGQQRRYHRAACELVRQAKQRGEEEELRAAQVIDGRGRIYRRPEGVSDAGWAAYSELCKRCKHIRAEHVVACWLIDCKCNRFKGAKP